MSALAEDFDAVDDVELEQDFGTVEDRAAILTDLLVRGETRDAVARRLGITRAEVDEHVAVATAQTEAEALNEREWIVRERLLSLVRQASRHDLSSFEISRLGLLVELARFELMLVARARRERVS